MVTTQTLAVSFITETESDALKLLLQKLLKEFDKEIQQVILFGSKARGDSTPDSDIDVLILMDDENWQKRTAISQIAARVELEYDVLLNTFLIASNRWQQMAKERFTLCRNIEKDGVLLFSRAG